MPQFYGLSETEYYIMDIIWKNNKPFSFNEISKYFIEQEKKSWKKQTLNTYIRRLINKGALTYSSDGNKNIYRPALSKEEYIQQWTQEFIDESFGGSLGKFMLALTGNNKKRLSQKDIDELKGFLNE